MKQISVIIYKTPCLNTTKDKKWKCYSFKDKCGFHARKLKCFLESLTISVSNTHTLWKPWQVDAEFLISRSHSNTKSVSSNQSLSTVFTTTKKCKTNLSEDSLKKASWALAPPFPVKVKSWLQQLLQDLFCPFQTWSHHQELDHSKAEIEHFCRVTVRMVNSRSESPLPSIRYFYVEGGL